MFEYFCIIDTTSNQKQGIFPIFVEFDFDRALSQWEEREKQLIEKGFASASARLLMTEACFWSCYFRSLTLEQHDPEDQLSIQEAVVSVGIDTIISNSEYIEKVINENASSIANVLALEVHDFGSLQVHAMKFDGSNPYKLA